MKQKEPSLLRGWEEKLKPLMHVDDLGIIKNGNFLVLLGFIRLLLSEQRMEIKSIIERVMPKKKQVPNPLKRRRWSENT